MTDFQTMRDEIMEIKRDLDNAIQNLPQYSASERPIKMQKIESSFGDLHSSIQELKSNVMMFSSNDHQEAKKFLVSMDNEVKNMENNYEAAKKKGSERDALFGGATMRANGSSSGQIGSLVDQRQQIEKGNDLTNELGRSVNTGKEQGIGILDALGQQSRKMDSIEGHLTDLDEGVERGDNIINQMLSRSNRRKIIMIIIIIILIAAFITFLYFVFAPKK